MKGNSKFPEYKVWQNMNRRCYNPNDSSYSNYGGRGIIVCERWRHSFQNFIEDMGRRPIDRLSKFTIERINNDGNYEPSNCKWLLQEEQFLNKRERIFSKQFNSILCRNLTCKNEFTPKRKDQRFCSPECKKEFLRLVYRLGVNQVDFLKEKLGGNFLHSLKSET